MNDSIDAKKGVTEFAEQAELNRLRRNLKP